VLARALRAFAARDTDDGEPTLDAELGSLAVAEFMSTHRSFVIGLAKGISKM
jgi:hypothetical protein